ncbi:MAG TPA: ABC transporter ATP-binding protein, partial [Acidimicrobiales bacterium]|nr:ABC transporter ATP-binding protein [Acidimicrobiales bacterium]
MRLVIDDLRVDVAGKEVLRGLDLVMDSGEVHVIMGPNGSGKSTLAHALAARPGYVVTGGSVTLDGLDLLALSASERARAGLILALQQPLEIPGVRPLDLLAAAGAAPEGLRQRMADEAARVGLRDEVLDRFVNVDLSGGERKRAEVVQIGVLRPAFAVFDEVDSGLDVDALGAVARRLDAATREWGCGILAITHFRRLLHELTPTKIHVVSAG